MIQSPSSYAPIFFSQGSLRIRTAVKPVGGKDYDLDLVCVLKAQPSLFTSAAELLELKPLVFTKNTGREYSEAEENGKY